MNNDEGSISPTGKESDRTAGAPKSPLDNLAARILLSVVFAPLLVWSALFPSGFGRVVWGLILILAAWEWAGTVLRKEENVLLKWMACVAQLGVFYLAFPFIYEMASPETVYGLNGTGEGIRSYLFFLILAVTWSVDTGAYFVGKFLATRDEAGCPRYPLARRFSPQKSWEGAVVGAFCGLLAGTIVSILFDGSPVMGMVLSMLFAVVGQIGDLLESILKRSVGLKDSGFIPGHGGALDRFDAFFANAAVASLVLMIVE